MRERSSHETMAGRSRWPAAESDALFDHDATLAFDLHARVRFCSAAARAMIGRQSSQVLDEAISALIPSLPLRAGTPGYNAAYIAFWFGRHRWHTYQVLDARRRAIAVDLTIEPAAIAGAPCFVLSMRQPPAASVNDGTRRVSAALLDDCSGQLNS